MSRRGSEVCERLSKMEAPQSLVGLSVCLSMSVSVCVCLCLCVCVGGALTLPKTCQVFVGRAQRPNRPRRPLGLALMAAICESVAPRGSVYTAGGPSCCCCCCCCPECSAILPHGCRAPSR